MAYSKYNTNRFRGDIPVKEGETYDVEIEGVGEKGDGIARIQGYVVIVPNTNKGDKVKIKVSAVRGRVSFGDVIGEAESVPENTGGTEDAAEATEEAGEEAEETGDTAEEAKEEAGEDSGDSQEDAGEASEEEAPAEEEKAEDAGEAAEDAAEEAEETGEADEAAEKAKEKEE